MGEKINVLVVDDEERFLNTIKKTLRARDFNVFAVNRGEKALTVARNLPIDIAVVDLKMPGMNGEQTLEMLKKEHKWMEVVILTGYGSSESAVDCRKKGAYSYLQKPCDFEQLLSVLAKAYIKRALNKMIIRQERMEEIEKMADSEPPLNTLRKIKELEKEESGRHGS